MDFSLQVQCEYEVSDLMRAASLRSLYPVTDWPAVVALGSFRVLMRIAQGSNKGLSHLGAAEKNSDAIFVFSRFNFHILLARRPASAVLASA